LPGNALERLAYFITETVPKGSIIIAPAELTENLVSIKSDYHFQPAEPNNADATILIHKLQDWMQNIYRGATDPKYLQDYLDEFCFRHNTANWNNHLAILDHLLTGIMGGAATEPFTIQPFPEEDT